MIDVLPRPKNFSFCDAITNALGLELGAQLPAQPAPYAVSFRIGGAIPVGDEMGSIVGLWRRTLHVGQELPTLPLPLNWQQAVEVSLEATYQRATKRAYLS